MRAAEPHGMMFNRFSAIASIALLTGCASAHPSDDVADAGSSEKAPPPASAPAPDGGHDDGVSPPTCKAESDCTGACPAGTKGCTCAQTPNGGLCIPTCTADADCPTPPTGALTCSPEHTCIPSH